MRCSPNAGLVTGDLRKLTPCRHRWPYLVTTSASGLDPDITPTDAMAEIPMVSRATGLSRSVLTKLINQQTQGAEWGFLGSPYINVLGLNEALVKLGK